MIECKELNKTFTTKSEMIEEMIARMDDIMVVKKSAEKRSDSIGLQLMGKTEATKSLQAPEGLTYGDYVYPVFNTTNIMDSHGDVHIPGLWKKTIPEQQGKVFLVANHSLTVGNVIAYPKDVELFTKTVTWKDLGANYEGETEALISKTRLSEKGMKAGVDAYIDGEPVEHSVRMIYVNIIFCVSPEFNNEGKNKVYNDNWEKYIGQVINREEAVEKGYFFAVTEARIYKECSMVLSASNSLTPTLYNIEKPSPDTSQAIEETQKVEPSIDTQQIIKELFNFKI